MNIPPRVSIITPSLNQGEFIQDALISVKNQRYSNLEQIVIDGGSTDQTLEILASYQGTYNLRWLSEPDQGHSDAVNKGFHLAEGEIIGWLNSDDAYFDPRVVEDVVRHFQVFSSTDVIYGDIVFMDRDRKLLLVRCTPFLFTYRRLLRGCFISQPAVFMRREVIEHHQLNPEIRLAVDYEYWLRIAREYRFRHMNRILAADRYYPDRRMLVHEKTLETENYQIRRKYSKKNSQLTGVWSKMDRWLTGPPRRVLGLWKLLGLLVKRDLVFDLRFQETSKVIYRQINPFKGYRQLLSKRQNINQGAE